MDYESDDAGVPPAQVLRELLPAELVEAAEAAAAAPLDAAGRERNGCSAAGMVRSGP
jgi:hypothetical protein